MAASAARKHVLGFFSHAGRPVFMNISTIHQWMFKADKPVSYPSDPDEITWSYEQGTELRDPTIKEVTDYWGASRELIHPGWQAPGK